MSKQWGAAAVVGVLALVAGGLVVLALRPANEPIASTTSPYESGAVAGAGVDVFRWVGPSGCNTEADTIPFERSKAGSAWETSDIPLVTVDELSFSDRRNGVAVGTTATCNRGVAVTDDGGRTWFQSPENPVLLDAWWIDGVIWAVERDIGAPQVAAFRTDAQQLRPVSRPSRPCSAADGALDQVAFWTAERGLLLCQNAVASSLLVARTANAGESFEALADDRPELGLDSVSEVVEMAVAGERSAWMLFAPGGTCPEGELRYSDTEGASFEPLPCPRNSVDVDEVLDVSFSTDTDGVMLALRDREPVMAVTTDGGATWSERG